MDPLTILAGIKALGSLTTMISESVEIAKAAGDLSPEQLAEIDDAFAESQSKWNDTVAAAQQRIAQRNEAAGTGGAGGGIGGGG